MSPETNLEEIKDRTLDTLEVLSATTKGRLVEAARFPHALTKEQRKALIPLTWVREVMSGIEKVPLWDQGDNLITWSAAVKEFFQALRGMGMTEHDWVYLAPTPSDLLELLLADAAKKSKEEILSLNIRVFGRCVSRPVLGDLAKMFGEEKMSTLTVGDVVKASKSQWQEHYCRGAGNLRLGLIKVRERLAQLGFTHADGYFFQFGTRASAVEEISMKLGISVGLADQFLKYAEDRYWIQKNQFTG